MGIVTSAGEPKISREQNYLAENPTRKKKMILLVAILAFGGLAIDAETTPDYGEDYWGGTVSNVGTTPDPWPPSAARCRRLKEKREREWEREREREREYCYDLLHPRYPTTTFWPEWRMNNPAKNDVDDPNEPRRRQKKKHQRSPPSTTTLIFNCINEFRFNEININNRWN